MKFLLEMEFFIFFSIKKLKIKRTIYLKKSIPYQIFYEYFNIDTPNDLKLAKKLYKKTQGN